MAITLNKKKDHFFISINKSEGVHSFVFLGVYDKNQVRHLLCRVGKCGVVESPDGSCTPITFLCKALFFSNKARLVDEGISRKNKTAKPITYQAYDINFTDYLEFVKLLESLQTEKNKFICYKPISENGDEVTLELTDKQTYPLCSAGKIKENASELKISNTCRHTAIALVEATQHAPVASLVSDNFFTSLPYHTQLNYGKPSNDIPFYVLPAAPTAFSQLTETKQKILRKLYARMEVIPILKNKSKATQDKFFYLKELYLQMIQPHDLSLNEVLQSIQLWKEQNGVALAELRKTYFWDSFITRQSATMNMITKMEQDLQKDAQVGSVF